MNKAEFMNRMTSLLDVLLEDEIKDILSEYEQHIDMKKQNGLSEEEAIEDFGSPEELAADILEAYHVRTDCKETTLQKKTTVDKIKESSQRVCTSAGVTGNKLIGKMKQFFQKMRSRCKRLMKKPSIFLQKWKTARQEKEAKSSMVEAGINKRQGNIVTWCLRGCLRFIFGSMFLLSGFMGIFLLFFVGMLVVMLLLGYPVIGITIGTIGATMTTLTMAFYFAIKMREGR